MVEDNEKSETSPGDGESDNWEEKFKSLDKQYKGVQRKLSKAQRTIDSRVQGEEVSARLDLVDQKFDTLLDLWSKTDVLDSSVVEAVKQIKNRGDSAKQHLGEETKALREIAELEVDSGVDFEEDEAAAIYWEKNDPVKAVEHFRKFVNKTPGGSGREDENVKELARLEAERMRKGASSKVDSGGSSAVVTRGSSVDTFESLKKRAMETTDVKELADILAKAQRLRK